MYDVSLFHIQAKVFQKLYCVKAQFYLQLSSGRNYKIVLLSSDRKANTSTRYLLVSFDKKYKKVTPINNKDSKEIMEIISKVELNDECEQFFKQIDIDKLSSSENSGLISLSNRVSIMIGKQAFNGEKNEIGVSLKDKNIIDPICFCFVAFNGMDQYTYFSLNSIQQPLYQEFHLLDDITIYILKKKIAIFSTDKLEVNRYTVNFNCSIYGVSSLKNMATSQLVLRNVDPIESLEFVSNTAGLEEWKMEYPEGHEPGYCWYTVIIPIRCIVIEREFGIGNVRFLKQTDEDVEELRGYMDKTNTKVMCYAKVYINEYSFYNALVKAKSQINQALDLVVNLCRDDSLFSKHSISNEIKSKDLRYLDVKPILDDWVYLENSFNEQKIIYNSLNISKITEMNVDSDTISVLENCQEIELLLIRLAESENKNVEPLFNALKWVRKAWDSNDKEDQIIYAIIALEFIVATEENSPLIVKQKKKLIKRDLEQSIRNNFVGQENIEELITELNKKIDFACSDTPFFVKLKKLIERLNVPVDETYIELIKSARGKRNDIVHGRSGGNLSLRDIKKLCEIVSLIAFYKINSLEVS